VDLLKFGVNKSYLLYVGNAYPHKNLERLIIAFGKLITEYMLDYQLVIAGRKDHFHEQLEKDVAEVRLDDRVIFTGYVSDAELAGLYKKASLYVFPSLSEGFGLPALEAMSYGVPVASSNATCLPEVAGEAAEYFDATDTAEMAKVMAALLSDKDRQQVLVERGEEQLKKFSWSTTAELTHKGYLRALRKK
jgi:glycosyltransferase involved in cell wall biosynthesis